MSVSTDGPAGTDRSKPTKLHHPHSGGWELFAHDFDIGVRGFGKTRDMAFEQAAYALSATIIRSPSSRGIAEEAPGAYKDVTTVVDVSERAGLARKVARLTPLACIKG